MVAVTVLWVDLGRSVEVRPVPGQALPPNRFRIHSDPSLGLRPRVIRTQVL
jgi:hypothetical protein